MKLRPIAYERAEAPKEMLLAAEEYERRFNIRFDSLTHFSKALLDGLHRPEPDAPSDTVTIASKLDPTILDDMEILSRVANTKSASMAQREYYFAALKSTYHKLPSRPDEATRDEDTLFVGIEREGRILAQSLGWLPSSHNLHPDAKRIPFENGLLIGLGQLIPSSAYIRCFIIDGAIASGATIITIVEKLRPITSSFNIFSVHATSEGLNAIVNYARSENLDLRVTVGHATTGIDDHFYAINPDDPNKLIVGDLGDTISDLVG